MTVPFYCFQSLPLSRGYFVHLSEPLSHPELAKTCTRPFIIVNRDIARNGNGGNKLRHNKTFKMSITLKRI